MDNKFYYLSQGLICPNCKSDKVYYIYESNSGVSIVKCKNCGEIMLEQELEEKKEENEK